VRCSLSIASSAWAAGRLRTATWPDELFTITSGNVIFAADGAKLVLSAGESIFSPPRVAHSYTNDGPDEARMTAVYTPARMEGWFRAVCPRSRTPQAASPVTPELLELMRAVGPRYSIEWLD
jgi:hypothetical protein